MYFRFVIAILTVITISLQGVRLEKQNAKLRSEIEAERQTQQQLSQSIASHREESRQLGLDGPKLELVESGELKLPSPENPSQIVNSPERELQ